MKDLGVMTIGVLVFALISFGAITAGDEPADGANTSNGVTVHAPFPDGIRVDPNPLPNPPDGGIR